jgi:translation elongation factor EF-Tu-like GTPase
MPAKFKVEATFTVPGRGLVVAGEVLEGSLRIGMTTQIPSWPRELTISGVEFVKHADRNPRRVGVLLRSQNEADYERWRAIEMPDQVVEFHDATPSLSKEAAQ